MPLNSLIMYDYCPHHVTIISQLCVCVCWYYQNDQAACKTSDHRVLVILCNSFNPVPTPRAATANIMLCVAGALCSSTNIQWIFCVIYVCRGRDENLCGNAMAFEMPNAFEAVLRSSGVTINEI